MPTVLVELGLPISEVIAGLPLQDDAVSRQRPAVLVRLPERHKPDRIPFRLRVIRSVAGEPVAPETDQRTRGVVDLFWKYLAAPGSEHLFRLPDEVTNRVADEGGVRQRMLDILAEIVERYPSGDAAHLDQDPETLEALEALGYVE
jgi:hypothetical protein